MLGPVEVPSCLDGIMLVKALEEGGIREKGFLGNGHKVCTRHGLDAVGNLPPFYDRGGLVPTRQNAEMI